MKRKSAQNRISKIQNGTVMMILRIIQVAQEDAKCEDQKYRARKNDALVFFKSDVYQFFLDFISCHITDFDGDGILPNGVEL